jgi:hypothetical protein
MRDIFGPFLTEVKLSIPAIEKGTQLREKGDQGNRGVKNCIHEFSRIRLKITDETAIELTYPLLAV